MKILKMKNLSRNGSDEAIENREIVERLENLAGIRGSMHEFMRDFRMLN